jgi:hypothetical protein
VGVWVGLATALGGLMVGWWPTKVKIRGRRF